MRSRLPILLLLCALCAGASPPERPTRAALRKAFVHNAASLVEVKGPRRGGAGVIAGASGQIVTSVHHVGLYEATALIDGKAHPARVITTDARLKVAVIELTEAPSHPLPAPAVHAAASLPRGTWLVGLRRDKRGAARPVTGRIVAAATKQRPFFMTDLILPPGSPLFDGRGRLVAMVVERAGRIGSRAISMERVQAHLTAVSSLTAEGAAP